MAVRGTNERPLIMLAMIICYTGERIVVAKVSNIPVDVASGASSSLSGGASPTFLKDRLCMDGCICETSTHSDVIRGVKKALVFLLGDGTVNEVTQGHRTPSKPDTLFKEIEIINAQGTDTHHVVTGLAPGIDHIDSIMNPKYITPYLKFGMDRGNADASHLRSFGAWGQETYFAMVSLEKRTTLSVRAMGGDSLLCGLATKNLERVVIVSEQLHFSNVSLYLRFSRRAPLLAAHHDNKKGQRCA